MRLGETVYVVQPTIGGADQAVGYVVRAGGSWFDLALAEELTDFLGRCIFVVIDAEERMAAMGSVERLPNGEVACRPTSSWRRVSLNRRAHTRYPAALSSIVWDTFGAVAPGTVTDISVRGCTVATVVELQGDELEVRIHWRGESLKLKCHRRSTTLVPDVTDRLLANHVQFVDPTAAEERFLKMMVDAHAGSWRRAIGAAGAGRS